MDASWDGEGGGGGGVSHTFSGDRDLTSYLVFRIIVSGAYLLFYLR